VCFCDLESVLGNIAKVTLQTVRHIEECSLLGIHHVDLARATFGGMYILQHKGVKNRRSRNKVSSN
jgi:hypothetical protein